jgi:hypothetical protein
MTIEIKAGEFAAEPSVGLAERAAKRLRAVANSVATFRPLDYQVSCFNLTWLSDPVALKAIDDDVRQKSIRSRCAIYAFRVREADAYQKIASAFGERALTDDGGIKPYSYSEYNASSDARALYVGSGRNLPGRISEHLGRTGGVGTYSMRLNKWASVIDADVDVHYWLYPSSIGQPELEALEQELWDELLPFFGKRSGK